MFYVQGNFRRWFSQNKRRESKGFFKNNLFSRFFGTVLIRALLRYVGQSAFRQRNKQKIAVG